MSAPVLVCLLTNLLRKNHFLAAADINNLRFVTGEAFLTGLDARMFHSSFSSCISRSTTVVKNEGCFVPRGESCNASWSWCLLRHRYLADVTGGLPLSIP